MTPEQALEFLLQMTTVAPLPLSSHLQARQAHDVIKASLMPQPKKAETVKVKEESKEAEKPVEQK